MRSYEIQLIRINSINSAQFNFSYFQKHVREKGYSWDMAKGFDTSLPVSRFISMDELKTPENVRLWLKVNGEMRQDANTSSLIYSVRKMANF